MRWVAWTSASLVSLVSLVCGLLTAEGGGEVFLLGCVGGVVADSCAARALCGLSLVVSVLQFLHVQDKFFNQFCHRWFLGQRFKCSCQQYAVAT